MKKRYPRDAKHFPIWIAAEVKHISLWIEQVEDEMWRDITKELPPLGEFVLFKDTKQQKVASSLVWFKAYAIGGLREAQLDKQGTWRYIDYGGLAVDAKDVKALLSGIVWMELPV